MKHLFLLLVCFPCWALAQIQVTIPEPEWREINSQIDSLINETDSLHNVIGALQDTIGVRNSVISSLLEEGKKDKSIIHDKDSLNTELLTQSEKNRSMYELAQKQILYADTCILKYANAQLYFKYDEKRIKNALSALNHISNKDMKEKQTFENLLNGYYGYFTEIKSLLVQAQNNQDRTNPFNGQQYILTLKMSIENLPYYRSHYKKPMNIPYLNDIIDTLLNLLYKAKPDDGIYADFSQIIESLQ